MLDFPLFSLNGAFCAAALGVAAFVRTGRREVMTLAACLIVNFVVCNLEYTPYAVRLTLRAWGVPATAPDVWLGMDTLFGVTAMLVGFWRWWGQALWALACLQVVLHLAYQAQLFDQYVYSDTLQVVLLAQLAVFFRIGGPRVWDDLRTSLDRIRRPRRPMDARSFDEAD